MDFAHRSLLRAALAPRLALGGGQHGRRRCRDDAHVYDLRRFGGPRIRAVKLKVEPENEA